MSKEEADKRIFPRLKARCPVLYQIDQQKSWKVGKMQNLSATGLQLICNESIQTDTIVHIHVKPGTQKSIPEIRAVGEVVRTETAEEGYIISCKLTEVSSNPH